MTTFLVGLALGAVLHRFWRPLLRGLAVLAALYVAGTVAGRAAGRAFRR